MQNDAAAAPITSPIAEEPTGFGAQVALWGPIVLVVFLIVVFKIGDADKPQPGTSAVSLPAAGPNDSDASVTSKEAETALLDKLIEDSSTATAPAAPLANVAPVAPTPPPVMQQPAAPPQGWGPPPAPGSAYWGAPNQGAAPAGAYPPAYPYGYPPYPYPPADPYWWTRQQQGAAPAPAQPSQ
ncbi:MAG: hypothetical protein K0U93_11935 [Gammaproteobacteria bacterium]|nr:hypothetical protein [Gammaproteobacteria bacterium]